MFYRKMCFLFIMIWIGMSVNVECSEYAYKESDMFNKEIKLVPGQTVVYKPFNKVKEPPLKIMYCGFFQHYRAYGNIVLNVTDTEEVTHQITPIIKEPLSHIEERKPTFSLFFNGNVFVFELLKLNFQPNEMISLKLKDILKANDYLK